MCRSVLILFLVHSVLAVIALALGLYVARSVWGNLSALGIFFLSVALAIAVYYEANRTKSDPSTKESSHRPSPEFRWSSKGARQGVLVGGLLLGILLNIGGIVTSTTIAGFHDQLDELIDPE